MNTLTDVMAALVDAQAKLDAANPDAARWRFIRKGRAGFNVVRWIMRGKRKTDEGDILRELDADAAIDAAIDRSIARKAQS